MKPTPDDSTPPARSTPPEVAPGPGEPPPVAAELFPGDRLALAQQYAELLASDGVLRGLIGPREAPRLWPRHLVNCALMSGALPKGATVADIGSGAGLPGLVLAIARPDVSITLVEPLLRRTRFLDEAVEILGLENVTVLRGRADVLHGVASFDIVTARAVAPLERLLGWCMPLVAPAGALVAMKGASLDAEIEDAGPMLRKLRCGDPVVEMYGEDLAVEDPSVEPIRLVRVMWREPSQVSLPTSGAGVRRSKKQGAPGRGGKGSTQRKTHTSRTRRQS